MVISAKARPMNKVAIFVKDFQKSTIISEKLANLDLEISFFESFSKSDTKVILLKVNYFN